MIIEPSCPHRGTQTLTQRGPTNRGQATTVGTRAAKSSVVDAYEGLKDVLRSAFGQDRVADASLTMFEAQPRNDAYVAALGQQLQEHADTLTDEVQAAAQRVLDLEGPAAVGQGSLAAQTVNIWASRYSVSAQTIIGGVHLNSGAEPRLASDPTLPGRATR